MAATELTQSEIAHLREMMDRQQIVRGIYEYARGIDRADVQLFKSVFWEDGIFDGGPAPGRVWEIADEMINEAVARRFSRSHHLFGNILIEFDGDASCVESYAVAYHQTLATRASIEELIGQKSLAEMGDADDIPYDLIIGLRYVDQWKKRGDVWKILVRKLVIDWSTAHPSSTLISGGIMDHLKWSGVRGSGDPSYGRLRASGNPGCQD